EQSSDRHRGGEDCGKKRDESGGVHYQQISLSEQPGVGPTCRVQFKLADHTQRDSTRGKRGGGQGSGTSPRRNGRGSTRQQPGLAAGSGSPLMARATS